MEHIEIFTGEQRHRRYTAQEKAKFAAMTMQPGYSLSLAARQNGITRVYYLSGRNSCKTVACPQFRLATRLSVQLSTKRTIPCRPSRKFA
ncbi:hypothetical protein J6I75_08690 [Pseudidiomarina sp. 1APP75-27a]|nr:hypothetical protein [Pseudidiomarina sp. 1APP75-27a]